MIPKISAQLAQRVDSAERTMRILWLALMGSVATYGVVIYQVSLDRAGVSPEPITLPPFVAPVLALSLAATGTVLFRAMSAPDRIRALLSSADAPQSGLQALPEAERRLSRVPPMFFTLYIIRWAIFESIAIVGLVLGILQGSFETFVPYGVAAIALIATSPPRIKHRVIEAGTLLPPDVQSGRI